MDAMIEDTDPDLKTGGEIEVGPETGQRSPIGSGATHAREEGADREMESEMGRGIEGTESGVGVGRSIGRDEVSRVYSRDM